MIWRVWVGSGGGEGGGNGNGGVVVGGRVLLLECWEIPTFYASHSTAAKPLVSLRMETVTDW